MLAALMSFAFFDDRQAPLGERALGLSIWERLKSGFEDQPPKSIMSLQVNPQGILLERAEQSVSNTRLEISRELYVGCTQNKQLVATPQTLNCQENLMHVRSKHLGMRTLRLTRCT